MVPFVCLKAEKVCKRSIIRYHCKFKQAFCRKAEMGNFELHAVHFSLSRSSVHSLCLNWAEDLEASTCGAREC